MFNRNKIRLEIIKLKEEIIKEFETQEKNNKRFREQITLIADLLGAEFKEQDIISYYTVHGLNGDFTLPGTGKVIQKLILCKKNQLGEVKNVKRK